METDTHTDAPPSPSPSPSSSVESEDSGEARHTYREIGKELHKELKGLVEHMGKLPPTVDALWSMCKLAMSKCEDTPVTVSFIGLQGAGKSREINHLAVDPRWLDEGDHEALLGKAPLPSSDGAEKVTLWPTKLVYAAATETPRVVGVAKGGAVAFEEPFEAQPGGGGGDAKARCARVLRWFVRTQEKHRASEDISHVELHYAWAFGPGVALVDVPGIEVLGDKPVSEARIRGGILPGPAAEAASARAPGVEGQREADEEDAAARLNKYIHDNSYDPTAHLRPSSAAPSDVVCWFGHRIMSSAEFVLCGMAGAFANCTVHTMPVLVSLAHAVRHGDPQVEASMQKLRDTIEGQVASKSPALKRFDTVASRRTALASLAAQAVARPLAKIAHVQPRNASERVHLHESLLGAYGLEDLRERALSAAWEQYCVAALHALFRMGVFSMRRPRKRKQSTIDESFRAAASSLLKAAREWESNEVAKRMHEELKSIVEGVFDGDVDVGDHELKTVERMVRDEVVQAYGEAAEETRKLAKEAFKCAMDKLTPSDAPMAQLDVKGLKEIVGIQFDGLVEDTLFVRRDNDYRPGDEAVSARIEPTVRTAVRDAAGLFRELGSSSVLPPVLRRKADDVKSDADRVTDELYRPLSSLMMRDWVEILIKVAEAVVRGMIKQLADEAEGGHGTQWGGVAKKAKELVTKYGKLLKKQSPPSKVTLHACDALTPASVPDERALRDAVRNKEPGGSKDRRESLSVVDRVKAVWGDVADAAAPADRASEPAPFPCKVVELKDGDGGTTARHVQVEVGGAASGAAPGTSGDGRRGGGARLLVPGAVRALVRRLTDSFGFDRMLGVGGGKPHAIPVAALLWRGRGRSATGTEVLSPTDAEKTLRAFSLRDEGGEARALVILAVDACDANSYLAAVAALALEHVEFVTLSVPSPPGLCASHVLDMVKALCESFELSYVWQTVDFPRFAFVEVVPKYMGSTPSSWARALFIVQLMMARMFLVCSSDARQSLDTTELVGFLAEHGFLREVGKLTKPLARIGKASSRASWTPAELDAVVRALLLVAGHTKCDCEDVDDEEATEKLRDKADAALEALLPFLSVTSAWMCSRLVHHRRLLAEYPRRATVTQAGRPHTCVLHMLRTQRGNVYSTTGLLAEPASVGATDRAGRRNSVSQEPGDGSSSRALSVEEARESFQAAQKAAHASWSRLRRKEPRQVCALTVSYAYPTLEKKKGAHRSTDSNSSTGSAAHALTASSTPAVLPKKGRKRRAAASSRGGKAEAGAGEAEAGGRTGPKTKRARASGARE